MYVLLLVYHDRRKFFGFLKTVYLPNIFYLYFVCVCGLEQCFDAVGWAAGRASGL